MRLHQLYAVSLLLTNSTHLSWRIFSVIEAQNAQFLAVSETAARIGGQVLRDWQGKFKVQAKAPSDLVTEADLASQKAIEKTVLDAFPDHQFVGEEQSDAGLNASTSDYRWIVDPLDGTTNYVHGFPFYCVSVALTYQGKSIAGTIYDPTRDECFSAALGGGATLNGEPIATSGTTQLNESLLVASFPAEVDRTMREVELFLRMLDRGRTIRRNGATALNLCYIGCGRLDGYWGTTAKSWDVAAGLLIASEAGATVTNVEGNEFDLERPEFLIAASPELHAEMLPLLND
jgi:myo-inositol-1(or 4)-monophosphatase